MSEKEEGQEAGKGSCLSSLKNGEAQGWPRRAAQSLCAWSHSFPANSTSIYGAACTGSSRRYKFPNAETVAWRDRKEYAEGGCGANHHIAAAAGA